MLRTEACAKCRVCMTFSSKEMVLEAANECGADVGDWRPSQYTFENEKFKKLWDVGFRYFCNVDSTQYWLQYGSNYMRQGRRNMDGQMMFKQMVYPEKVLTSDLFDVYDVFDRRRPLPVNGITVPEDFDLQALADSLGMSDRIIN